MAAESLPLRQPRPVAEELPESATQWQPVPSAEGLFTHREPGAEESLPLRQPMGENRPSDQEPDAELPRRHAPPESPAESTGSFFWQKPQFSDELPMDTSVPEEPEAEPSWSFDTDESWRTVQTVSQSAPSGYTAAGLPRRRRGEQLMPGSASSGGAPGPRTQRDPQDVRGRLNSFQQGVRRGRHRTTAQAADSEHETLEGE
jgi:hypothetical protein